MLAGLPLQSENEFSVLEPTRSALQAKRGKIRKDGKGKLNNLDSYPPGDGNNIVTLIYERKINIGNTNHSWKKTRGSNFIKLQCASALQMFVLQNFFLAEMTEYDHKIHGMNNKFTSV
jgi:hypothetical protein